MCILCKLELPLHVGVAMTCVQFCLWFVSAGVFTCSWGKYGLYVEQYTRWGLCFLAGGVVMLYITMMGMMLGSAPQYDWPDLVIANVKDLVITDYDRLAQESRQLMHLQNMLVRKLPSGDADDQLGPAAQNLVQEVLSAPTL